MAFAPKYKVGDKVMITEDKHGSILTKGDIVTIGYIDYGDPSLTYKSTPHALNVHGSWFSESRCRAFANTPGEDCIF